MKILKGGMVTTNQGTFKIEDLDLKDMTMVSYCNNCLEAIVMSHFDKVTCKYSCAHKELKFVK
jgi:hypothetical protein